VHFDYAGSDQRGFHDLGLQLFPSEFSRNFFPAACRCALRLRRWEQNGCPVLGPRLFSCTCSHNLSCGMSMCISIGQARTKRGSLSWGATFSCKFLRCHALLRCPCAFRLHRLAQSLLCGGFTILVPGFFLFLHTTAPCACQLTCLCACRLRMLARSLRCGVLKLLVCGIFIVNSRVNGLLWG